VVHWTKEADKAFGDISIFPTLFLLDRKGIIIRHWIGFLSPEELGHAVADALAVTQPAS